MEKVSLYVRKILALGLSFSLFFLITFTLTGYNLIIPGRISGTADQAGFVIFISAVFSFLLFAYLSFRISGEKPRFLFGMNQSDNFLNEKGGFWNLFKWIVTLFGFLYDMLVWTLWGVFQLFVLFAELLLLIKEILYWIIHAIIWFIRQLFPPFIFLFKMILHYPVYWTWWLYQVAVNNMKKTINRNFYFIALWGTVPALFIIFLFYAISQVVGIPGLTAISVVFALIPLVWSFGEISALRHEGREKDEYQSVSASFSNGFEAVKGILFYLILIVIFLVAEILLNLLGWIPNLSMSILGITINLNMALSFLLVFLAIIISFAGGILPTYILHHPDHDNDLDSTLKFLKVLGNKFLRYSFIEPFNLFFGSVLLVIPIVVMLLAYSVTDGIKDAVLQTRIEQLSSKRNGMQAMDDYVAGIRIDRMEMYQEIPLLAPKYFSDLANSGSELEQIEGNILRIKDRIAERRVQYDADYAKLTADIENVSAEAGTAPVTEQIERLSGRRDLLEKDYKQWENSQYEKIAYLSEDMKELKRQRIQMPVLYLFTGIFIAFFGGIVFAVYVMYIGNVYYEIYSLREDGKPSKWVATLDEIRKKDPKQPLLGFTFLALLAIIVIWRIAGAGLFSFL